MGTPVDSLYVGNWIAICGEKDDQPDHDTYGMPFMMFGGPPKPVFDGRPLKIVAISLPYIAVESGRHRFSLDVRRYSVIKLHKKYVQKMAPKHFNPQTSTVDVAEVEAASRSEEQARKDSMGCCPRCGERMVQRLISDGKWAYFCRECKFMGGDAPDQTGT